MLAIHTLAISWAVCTSITLRLRWQAKVGPSADFPARSLPCERDGSRLPSSLNWPPQRSVAVAEVVPTLPYVQPQSRFVCHLLHSRLRRPFLSSRTSQLAHVDHGRNHRSTFACGLLQRCVRADARGYDGGVYHKGWLLPFAEYLPFQTAV